MALHNHCSWELFSWSLLFVNCTNTASKKAKERSLLSGLQTFSYKELGQATNGFKKLLGKGGFGEVHTGKLSRLHLPHIAVKTLLECKSEKNFENEVRSIGHIHHKNLVRMIGYCKEGAHRMLVFEYMQGGTLADLIFAPERPCRSFLAEAAKGIARGLEYLAPEWFHGKGKVDSKMDVYNCVLCQPTPEETTYHLFFLCPFSVQCWNFLGIQFDHSMDFFQTITKAKEQFGLPFFMEIFATAAWEIWKHRNACIFRSRPISFDNWKAKSLIRRDEVCLQPAGAS